MCHAVPLFITNIPQTDTHQTVLKYNIDDDALERAGYSYEMTYEPQSDTGRKKKRNI